MEKWLRKISHISAWALLLCVAVLVLSGWGITQTDIIYKISFGLVDRRLADEIHRASILPLTFFFLLHILINIRFKFTNRRPGIRVFADAALIAVGAAIMAAAIYMEYFAGRG